MFSSTNNILNGFTNYICNTFLFPIETDREILNEEDFKNIMNRIGYILIKPHEIRKRYTEYAIKNKTNALIPTKMTRKKRDFDDESELEESKGHINDASSYFESDSI